MFHLFFQKKDKIVLPERKPMWEYSEKPIFSEEDKEIHESFDAILTKLEEIEKLVKELREREK
jgi:hypothetical protein